MNSQIQNHEQFSGIKSKKHENLRNKNKNSSNPSFWTLLAISQKKKNNIRILPLEIPELNFELSSAIKSMVPEVNDVSEEKVQRKYSRQWSLELVEHLYSRTQSFAHAQGKLMDSLSLEDYGLIGEELGRSGVQCMLKMRSVLMSGSFRSGVWSRAEDDLLWSLVSENLPWKEISYRINSIFHGGFNVRNSKHCSERWQNHLNPAIKHGSWTELEDMTLIYSYKELGSAWDTIAARIGNRTGTAAKNRFNSLVNREKKTTKASRESSIQALIRKYTGAYLSDSLVN